MRQFVLVMNYYMEGIYYLLTQMIGKE